MRKITVEELLKMEQLPKQCVVVDKETGKQTRRRTDTAMKQIKRESVVLIDDDEPVPVIMADIHQDNTLIRLWLS